VASAPSKRSKEVVVLTRVKRANASRALALREHPGLTSGNPVDVEELIRSAKNEGGSGGGGAGALASPERAAKSGNPRDLEELIRAAKAGDGARELEAGAPSASASLSAPALPLAKSGDLEELIRSAKAGDGDASAWSPVSEPRRAPAAEPARHGDDWESPQSSRHRNEFEESTLVHDSNDANTFPSMSRPEASTETPFLAEPHFEKEPLVQPLEEPQPLGEAHYVPAEVGNIREDEFLAGLAHGAHKKNAGKSIAFRREDETAAAVAKEMTENFDAWKPGRRPAHRRAVVAGRPLAPASEQTKHLLSTHNLVEQIESEAASAEADHIEVRYREPPKPDASAPNATGEPQFAPPPPSAPAANLAAMRGPAPLGGSPPAEASPVPMLKSEATHQAQLLAGAVALAVVVAPLAQLG
jgi:hypothetical protein